MIWKSANIVTSKVYAAVDPDLFATFFCPFVLFRSSQTCPLSEVIRFDYFSFASVSDTQHCAY
jgi:hypothetical protein